MEPTEYLRDNLLRLDAEILIATRAAEAAEVDAGYRRTRCHQLEALRLEASIGGSGNWFWGLGVHVLDARNKHHQLAARVSLYTGGTQEWFLSLLERRRGKFVESCEARGDTPRAALGRLQARTLSAAVEVWLQSIHERAIAWDDFNVKTGQDLGLLNRVCGP